LPLSTKSDQLGKDRIMPVEKLLKFLDDNEVKYVRMKHSSAFSAQEIAASAHIPGDGFAKSVIVKIDGKMAMAVLPASYRIDLDLLKKEIGVNSLELASEDEFSGSFPDCETGAMPPFGNLYGMDVYVARSLTEVEEIAFNACSHVELIKMAYKDFERLAHPKIIKFSYKE